MMQTKIPSTTIGPFAFPHLDDLSLSLADETGPPLSSAVGADDVIAAVPSPRAGDEVVDSHFTDSLSLRAARRIVAMTVRGLRRESFQTTM